MNVPTICSARSAMASRIVLRKRNVIPIATSHHPMRISHISPSNKGSQRTVAMTRGSAGDRPSGLRTPNQIKMMPNETRKARIPQRRINADIERSISSKFIGTCIVPMNGPPDAMSCAGLARRLKSDSMEYNDTYFKLKSRASPKGGEG